MLQVILDGFDACLSLFVACELAQRITNAFEVIGNSVCIFKWYRFPNEIKQMLPTILIMVEQPVEFVCFGSFSMCRESFKQV